MEITQKLEKEITENATKLLAQMFNWKSKDIESQISYLLNDLYCCDEQKIMVKDKEIVGLMGELAVKKDPYEIITREDRDGREYKSFKSHALKMMVTENEFVYVMQDCDVYEPHKCEGYTEYWNEKYTIVARTERN